MLKVYYNRRISQSITTAVSVSLLQSLYQSVYRHLSFCIPPKFQILLAEEESFLKYEIRHFYENLFRHLNVHIIYEILITFLQFIYTRFCLTFEYSSYCKMFRRNGGGAVQGGEGWREKKKAHFCIKQSFSKHYGFWNN